jgi:hypothetical protein
MPEVDNVPPPGIVSTETLTTTPEITFASAPLDATSSTAAAPTDQAEVVEATLIGVPTGS